jgi:hypothetical protein
MNLDHIPLMNNLQFQRASILLPPLTPAPAASVVLVALLPRVGLVTLRTYTNHENNQNPGAGTPHPFLHSLQLFLHHTSYSLCPLPLFPTPLTLHQLVTNAAPAKPSSSS